MSVALLFWVLCSYGHTADPVGHEEAAALDGAAWTRWRISVLVRAVATLLFVVFLLLMPQLGLPDASPPREVAIAGGCLLLAVVGLPVARLALQRRAPLAGRVVELELLVNGVVAVSLAPRALPIPVAIAGAVFLVRGGTHVVRALLDRAGTLPTTAGPALPDHPDVTVPRVVDEQTYNRGRLIGSLERLLLYVLVLGGSYAAVGFVVAAKGIVRIKELEDRDFGEYFLVGTLASVLLAVVVGAGVAWTHG